MLALIEELSQILKKQNQPGFAGATSAPSSGANHFMSSPPSRSGILSGPELSKSSRSPGAKNHHAATRALAYKWIRIIWKCWQTHTPYNEVYYLDSLRKKGSPLLAFAAPKPKTS